MAVGRKAISPDKSWLDRHYNKDGSIVRPDELEGKMSNPPSDITVDSATSDRIHGSMIGMALGDALGAFVEFRPHDFMVANPVKTLEGGGTWGLEKGQFTDDTSMALCLANSLVARRDYVPYDQLVRYKWWHREGYMSSTGKCFDIGAATKQSLREFERRQEQFAEKHKIPLDQMDALTDTKLIAKFNENCSEEGVAGNGALMRLAPVPLFFYRDPIFAVKCSGHSGEITHGDEKAYDACRYYGALIVAAVRGESREDLLSPQFYQNHEAWFDGRPLQEEIMQIAQGSYQKDGGYKDGIRGKGYIVDALKAALWAFWSCKTSFQEGALAAVNLGDDTDTTAAIYGQLAGAYYGYQQLPKDWVKEVYARKYIKCLSKWIAYEGEQWYRECKAAQNALDEKDNFKRRRSKTVIDPVFSDQTTSVSPETNDPKSNYRPRRKTCHELPPSPHVPQPGKKAFSHPSSSENEISKDSSSRIYNHERVKTTDQLCKWLVLMYPKLEDYVKLFQKHDVSGYWFLNHINDEELQKLKVKNKDDRRAIVDAVDRLRAECPEIYAQK